MSPSSSAEFKQLNKIHQEALAKLLRVGVDMRTIRRTRLDDPRISEGERMERLGMYLEKRKEKMVRKSPCFSVRVTAL